MRVHLERSLTTDGTNEVMRHQCLIGLPTATSPYQPFAPGCAISPLIRVSGGERQRQRIVGRPHRGILRCHGLGGLHTHARARRNERVNVKALGQRIGCIPSISLVIRRQEHIARESASVQYRLRRCHRVLPARLIPIRPDQDDLARQR